MVRRPFRAVVSALVLLPTVAILAPVQMLFTGHMDTVFPVDHPFQAVTPRDDGTVNGPGVFTVSPPSVHPSRCRSPTSRKR